MAMTWHQCPVDAGQAVSVEYSVDWENGVLLRRTEDRGDNSVTLERGRIADGEHVFEPWNGLLPQVVAWSVVAAEGDE